MVSHKDYISIEVAEQKCWPIISWSASAKKNAPDTTTALKTHTIATLIMGLTGLATLQIMAWVLL